MPPPVYKTWNQVYSEAIDENLVEQTQNAHNTWTQIYGKIWPHPAAPNPDTWIPATAWRNTKILARKAANEYSVDPLVINFSDQPLQTVSISGSNAFFNYIGGDFALKTGWLGTNSGLLVLDRNYNGTIDSLSELFGNDAAFSNGFAKLASYDSNSDGIISATDPVFSNLQVWIDGDSDGRTDPGELMALAELDISTLNLAWAATNILDHGNLISAVGTYTLADGSTRQLADIDFAVSLTWTRDLRPIVIPTEVKALPDLQGVGELGSLWTSMATDHKLKELVEDFVRLPGDAPVAAIRASVDAIIYRWTGTDGIAPASRGSDMDARQVAAFELLVGMSLTGHGLAAMTHAAFTRLETVVAGRLLLAGPLGPLGGDFAYDPKAGVVKPTTSLAQALAGAVAYAGDLAPASFNAWSKVAMLFATVSLSHGARPLELAEAVASVAGINAGALVAATAENLKIEMSLAGSLTVSGDRPAMVR